MKHVLAFVGLSILYASFASQLNIEANKKGEIGNLVSHSHQSGVKVDLACQGGNGNKAGRAFKSVII